MAEKQLIVVVEGTAAMGPYWSTVVSDYIDKIIRSLSGNDLSGQKPAASTVEMSLVTFNTHGSYSGCLVQRSGWTRDVELFLQWLSAIPLAGGGFSDAAIAEGLSEALMMFPIIQNGRENQQNVDFQKHCILVAASNPHPLPTPVYRPQIQNVEQSENFDAQTESRLYDAEAVAKAFAQCFVSLSVICPKQLPKLRTIYNAGKRNPRAADPPIDNVKNPHFLVLISENFLEARATLSRPGSTTLPSNPSPVKMDIAPVASVTGPPPTSMPSVNGSVMNRPSVSVGNVPPATVKVEPSTVSSMVAGPAFAHVPSVRPPSQGVPTLQTSSPSSGEMIANNESVPDLKPIVSGVTHQRPVGSILNNISQARVMNSAALSGGTTIGLQNMGQNPMAMHVSNMISSGMASSVAAAQNAFSPSGPHTLTQVPQSSGLNSFTSATSNVSGNSNLGMSQPMSNLQGGVNIGQSVPGMSQNHSGPQMVQSGIGMNPNMMSGLGSAVSSSGNGTMMPTPGISQQPQSGMQSLGANNSSVSNPLSQQTSSALTSAQSKYVKVWEGNLSGQRQGQPVFITRLEGYRSASASETLAANWPPTMQIVRLISQDHMNNKQYVGRADFLVFRAMNQHGFLGQLQEKKLCAVIQLPSQTLLLSVSDKACRLIGMLFPGDMVVFKPQVGGQQQMQQMQPQLQPMQQQQPQLQQLQQQQPQLQQMQQQQPQLQQQQLQPQLQPMQQQQPQLQQLQQQQPQLQQMQQQQPQLQQQQLQPQLQQPQPQPQLQQQQQHPQMQQQQQQHPQMQQQQQHPQMQQQQQHPQMQQQQQHPQMQQQQQHPQMQQQQQHPQMQQQQQHPQMQQQQQHPQMQQQQQLSQLQSQQQIPQLQQQHQHQQQQLVGGGMGQAYGQSRSQLVSQGQVSSQQGPNMPGGGFMG